MRRLFSKIKLKHQIIILLGIVIGTMTMSLITYMAVTLAGSRRDRQNYVEGSVEQLTKELNQFDRDMKRMINTLAYNRTVEEFIMSQDLGQRYILSQNISLILDSAQISNPRLDALILTNLDEMMIGTQDIEFFRIIKELKIRMSSTKARDLAYYRMDQGQILCVNPSFTNYKTGVQYYVIAMINMDHLQSMIQGMTTFDHTVFIIKNSDGAIIYPDNYEENSFSGQGKSYDMKSESGVWEAVGTALPAGMAGVSGQARASVTIMILVVIFVSMGLCLFGYLIYSGIASPVEAIIEFMNQYGKFYNKQRLPVEGTNEIAQLSASVNRMLDDLQIMTRKIVNTQEQLYLVELAKRQAELTALQIQMNPHFLYNTLDCIRGIALVHKVPEVARIATAMSRILRYSIKSEDMVPVKQELDSIEDYLRIIQIRHENKYEISISAEEEIRDMMIPKMILQPLVENAVFYGLERQSGKGCLSVGAALKEESLLFLVENSGESITEEKVQELSDIFEENKNPDSANLFSEKESIGLKNIDKRIKILYGEDYGLRIQKRDQGGTVVLVMVPVIRVGNKNRK